MFEKRLMRRVCHLLLCCLLVCLPVVQAAAPGGTAYAEGAVAPKLFWVWANSSSDTTGQIGFASREEGTYYYLVYEAADPAPNAAMIEAQGPAKAKGTGAMITSDGHGNAVQTTVNVTGLTPSTAYKAYVIVKFEAGYVSDMETIAFSTTLSIPQPTVSVKGDTTATLTFTINTAEDWGFSYLVYPADSQPDWFSYYDFQVYEPVEAGTNVVNLSGLSASTAYKVYFDFIDSSIGYLNMTIDFMTSVPEIRSTSASGTTATATTLNFTSDMPGNYYYVVYEESETAPVATIIEAQGAAAAKGTGTAIAGANTAEVTGLTASTAYKAYVVVKNADKVSEVATISFTTGAAPTTATWTDIGESGDFTRVCGVTVDGKGIVYVTDCNANKVMKSNGSLEDITWEDITYDLGISPSKLAVDSIGTVYVLNMYYGIKKLLPGSETWVDVTGWGDGGPQVIAVDRSDNLYVAHNSDYDFGNSKVSVLSGENWNDISEGENFYFPYGLTVASNGDVYVTDDYYNILYKRSGNSWTAMNLQGTYEPDAIAIDSSNNVYITENNYRTHNIHKLWGASWSEASWSNVPGLTIIGKESGQTDIYVDKYDNIYVTNESNKVMKLLVTPPAVNDVSISPSSASIVQGGSEQLTVSVDAIGFADETVEWTSSDGKVTVDSTGYVTVASDASLGDYTITATSEFDDSKLATATITVTAPQLQVPDAPVLQSAVASDGQVTLTWSSVADSTGYKIYKRETSGTYDAEAATVNSSDSSYVVTGLTNGTTYYFMVKATNSDGDSDASNEVSATPLPEAPTLTSVTPSSGPATGGTTVTLTGTNLTGATAVTFGGTAATSFTVVSDTEITAVAPAHAAGAVDVAVTTVGGTATSAGGYTYMSTPSLPASDNSPSSPSATTGVEVLVNGKVEQAGTATRSMRNDQTVTTIVIDQQKLEERYVSEGQGAVVTIPSSGDTDVVITELNGQMAQNMESRQVVIRIQTDNVTYTLPAKQLNISAISDKFGNSVALQDIKVHIEIASTAADQVNIIENAAEKGAFTIVVPSVDFTVKAVYGDTVVEISKFSAYVERTLAIPDEVDPDKITTGVVVEADGTVRHVPTQIRLIDGKYNAVINSLTNSSYTVVWHPLEFNDVATHWAKKAVNDMGSRMVIAGTGDGQFSPDRHITRAEFAAILVRGLGLKLESDTGVFSDVNAADWYGSAVQTAYIHGLIDGYIDGTFRPNDKITREQAMAILAKAMKLTGLSDKLSVPSVDDALRSFEDAGEVAAWAQDGVANSVHAGIVTGRSANTLVPQDYMTRAEVAVTIRRLLMLSRLI